MHSITDQDIKRFFNKQCTNAEAAKIATFLDKHPEILDQYLDYASWEEQHLHQEITDEKKELWSKLRRAMQTRKRGRWVRPFVAAASILLLFVAGLIYFFRVEEIDIVPSAVENQELVYQRFGNKTSVLKTYLLKDKSKVLLYPGSEMELSANYASVDRHIHLQGKAEFQVSDNNKLPFTVHTGSLSTVALGTVFFVDAPLGADQINILLKEGKIAVRHATFSEVLLPGDRFDFTVSTGRGRLSHKTATESLAGKKRRNSDKAGKEKPIKQLVFDNKPLAEVFAELADNYNAKIDFSEDELRDIYFIGKFNATDSLVTILSDICLLNNLDFKVDGSQVYRIKRK